MDKPNWVPPADPRAVISAHQKEAPVRLAPIARELGLDIIAANLPSSISGMLQKDATAPSGYRIIVNREEPKNRQRFTVAHEIAHFIRHRDEVGEGIADDTFYRSALSNRMEWEANEMAADILMPWVLIRELTDSGVRDPMELAKKLGVSETAMRIRLGLPT